jgi:diguanylate cyclase (GGDEF)-like protein/PAS domain S-box-containing protein
MEGRVMRRRGQTQQRRRARVRQVVRDRTRTLRQLLASRTSAIVDSCDDAVIAKTLDGIIVAWNPAAERVYGYSAGEVIGKHIRLLFPPESTGELAASMQKLRKGERIEPYETVRLRKDGVRIDVSVTISPILGPRGAILGASVIARDITERRKALERIQYLATHDSLTGLANYGALMDAFETELCRSGRTGRPFSVLLLDLDGLKSINDHFGHLVGSRALCRFARILRYDCRSIDTAARYGGDEFAVLLIETEKRAASQAGERITRRLEDDGEMPRLSASFGVSTYPCDGYTAEALLAAADRALYQDKRRKSQNVTLSA